MGEPLRIVVEQGTKKVFVSAADWPGWSRGGRSVEEARAALLAWHDRYAQALERVGLPGPPRAGDGDLLVVEVLEGGAGTDFGVPSRPSSADLRPVKPADGATLCRFLRAAWGAWDEAAERAQGHALRVGPRGGGRDLDRMLDHVVGAEEAYLVQVGARPPTQPATTPAERWPAVRARHLEVVTTLSRGEDVPDPSRAKHPWPLRYHVARTCWHTLDHAWELEDRLLP